MSQEEKKESEETTDEQKNGDTPEDKLSITHHSVIINGEEIRYTATTGTLILKEEIDKEGEKPKAAVFFIAYTLDDVEDASTRPVTFSFNGGPGSSSVWLHLGVLGPRCVKPDDDGELPQPPYQLTNNECSILDKTDLVLLIQSAQDSAERYRGKRQSSSTDSKEILNPSAISSSSIWDAINVGGRLSSLSAKVMEQPVPVGLPVTCRNGTAPTLTVLCSFR